eukprot:364331-Chlamydomonas_euryale.AAC.5
MKASSKALACTLHQRGLSPKPLSFCWPAAAVLGFSRCQHALHGGAPLAARGTLTAGWDPWQLNGTLTAGWDPWQLDGTLTAGWDPGSWMEPPPNPAP